MNELAVSTALADAFLGAEHWTPSELLARGQRVLGDRPPWLAALAVAAVTAHRRPPRDAPREFAWFLLAVRRRAEDPGPPARVQRRLPTTTRAGRTRWLVTPVADLAELAALLGTDVGHLSWYADVQQRRRSAPPGWLHLYRRVWLPRPGRTPRLLEVPTPRLRRVQRLVLDQVLGPVPVHPAAHGFVPGRSALTGARRHVGAEVVVTMDLAGFFASVRVGRVYGVARTAGYPEPVARVLAGLCTTTAPVDTLRTMPAGGPDAARWALRRALAVPHLPQGAPSSQHLANLCAHRLDRRLAGYAEAVGAEYTRYADDLTFSGDLRRCADGLVAAVGRIVADEGFALNPTKTLVRGRARRQTVTGIVVNDRPNVPRRDYDALKAQLVNAARRGPAARDLAAHPDLRAHLAGRVAWVAQLHPERGRRLRALLDQVSWPVPGE